MEALICKKCGAQLEWNGRSETAACSYCGTTYRLRPRNSSSGVKIGRGKVDAIMTSAGRYAGYPLVESYIPEGWSVQTNAPESTGDVLAPLCVQAAFTSPGQDAFITYTGSRVYNHIDNTPQNAQRQGQISHPDYVACMSYMESGAVCDSFVANNPNLVNPKMISETHDDAWANRELQRLVQEFMKSGGIINPGGNWTRKVYEVQDRSGNKWFKIIEALVTYVYLPVTQEEQMLYQMLQQTQARTMGNLMQTGRFMGGGVLGGLAGLAGLAGAAGNIAGQMQQIKQPQPKLRWCMNFVVETSAVPAKIKDVLGIHEQIRNTMKALPLMEREGAKIRQQLLYMAQQESNTINNAMADMNRQRMASWERRQNIMRDASDYGTRVMRDMYESTSATNDRINNLRSEAIRGVNTYHTMGGDYRTVEADISYDHVYQNVRRPDQFGAAEGAPFDFGVDFEELERTKGDY